MYLTDGSLVFDINDSGLIVRVGVPDNGGELVKCTSICAGELTILDAVFFSKAGAIQSRKKVDLSKSVSDLESKRGKINITFWAQNSKGGVKKTTGVALNKELPISAQVKDIVGSHEEKDGKHVHIFVKSEHDSDKKFDFGLKTEDKDMKVEWLDAESALRKRNPTDKIGTNGKNSRIMAAAYLLVKPKFCIVGDYLNIPQIMVDRWEKEHPGISDRIIRDPSKLPDDAFAVAGSAPRRYLFKNAHGNKKKIAASNENQKAVKKLVEGGRIYGYVDKPTDMLSRAMKKSTVKETSPTKDLSEPAMVASDQDK